MIAPSPDRIAEIRENREEIEERIAAACDRAGRPSDAVTLIAVTKTFPVQDVQAAIEAGLADFGENRVQELLEKQAAIPGAKDGGSIRWHLIGSLQRNKARDAVAAADQFHALDSARLAEALNRKAEAAGRVLPCNVQVNVSGEGTKSGLAPGELHPFLDTMEAYSNLRVEGLMTLAAPAADDRELDVLVRPQFRLLRSLAEGYKGKGSNVDLQHLSMGMSGDFEVAIEEGATHVRIGSALFGSRT